MAAANNETKRIYGGESTVVVVGAALTVIDAVSTLRGYAVTCRVTGTIIAAVNVMDEGGAVRAYAPTWSAIALYAGETFISPFPIYSIQLTGAADSVAIQCDKPY